MKKNTNDIGNDVLTYLDPITKFTVRTVFQKQSIIILSASDILSGSTGIHDDEKVLISFTRRTYGSNEFNMIYDSFPEKNIKLVLLYQRFNTDGSTYRDTLEMISNVLLDYEISSICALLPNDMDNCSVDLISETISLDKYSKILSIEDIEKYDLILIPYDAQSNGSAILELFLGFAG